MADDLQKPERLYDRDYVAWTEQQATALRARKGGENALDYDNLAEEIEDLGKAETRACASLIDRIIEHLLKIEFAGPSEAVGHWRKEVRAFRRDLARTVTPVIRNRLEPTLAQATEDVVKGLVDEGFLPPETLRDTLVPTYAWDQIVSPDWFPSRSDIG